MKILTYLFLLGMLPYVCKAQLDFNFFISNSGKNSNRGTSEQIPKKTISGTKDALDTFSSLHGAVSVGLKSNDIFNETLIPSSTIKIGAYGNINQAGDFAILNGTEVYNEGWEKVSNLINTFSQLINFSSINSITVGAYSYIYVVEIDKELEKTSPYSARKILKFASSIAAVDTIPGSVFETTATTNNPIILFIHTSDGNSPNANAKYRYEVTVRDRGVDAYKVDNNYFENLWVRGYSAGYGLLPGGKNSYYNKIIFGPGAAIHHSVIKSGTINNSLFLRGLDVTDAIAIVFYDFEGFQRHNKITNSIFLDIKNPVYTHTHGTETNYGAIDLDNIYAFADKSVKGNFASSANTDSILLNNIYTDGYTSGLNYSSAKYVSIKNSYFKEVEKGIVLSAYNNAHMNNLFIKSEGNNDNTGIEMYKSNFLEITNSIIHIKGIQVFADKKGPKFIDRTGEYDNRISSNNNIFICDISDSMILTSAAIKNENGIGSSPDIWDSNVYILLKGRNIQWIVMNGTNGGGNVVINSFEEWKRLSGQDKNSLFFDLRNDPRGLKSVFIDPENGNYELANTVAGNKIRNLKAGMLTPLSCFLKKPTYEAAAEMIKNGNMLKVNSCRLNCQQTDVKLEQLNTNLKICQKQPTSFKGSGNYNENDLAYHQSDLTSRYLWWFSDETDTSGVNLNSITHRFDISGNVNCRLQIVDINGCSFDTSFISLVKPSPIVTLGKDTTICKGSELILTSKSNYSSNEYLWNTGNRSDFINIKDKGIYWVQATFNGCSSRDSIQIKTDNCNCTYQIPNSFSPNGDGVNDVYNPFFTCPPTTYSLSVFNRFGQLVFKSTDYKNSWNGFLDGKPLPMGVYVYVLNFTNEKYRDSKPISGSITLLR